MSYPGAADPLDYFSYQPHLSQQMLSFDAWPTTIFPPWDTTAFTKVDPAMFESDHLLAPDLFFQTIHRPASNEEPEFNQSAIRPDPAMCESDHLQGPDLFVQTIHRPASNVEPEFNQSAILPTEATETQGLASESSPTRPEYVAMARETLSPRSPSLPKGRAKRRAKPKGVSLRDGISKPSRRERNKESATKHRLRQFKMMDEAWDLLPDEEKRGLDDTARLDKLEKALGYFRELQSKHSQILAILG
jgi:hypothetical protein